MAETILLPRQGNSVESCIILEWKKQEGDTVSEGETICEVETDKATFEVEATASGVLRKHLVSEGDDVPVLAPIAIVGEPDEDISALLEEANANGEANNDAASAADSDSDSEGESESEANSAPGGDSKTAKEGRATATGTTGTRAPERSGDGSAAVSPRARMRAEEKGIDPESLTGSGPEGRVIERDVLAAAESRGPVTSTAKEILSAAGGRISAEQATAMQQAGPGGSATSGAGAEQREVAYPGGYEDKPVRSVRKVIAERMHASLQDTAQLTLNRRADARALLAFRRRLKGSKDEALQGISINDLILYAVTKALSEFPDMNSHFLGETIRTFSSVHLGFAVDTERGLMVPTIANADSLSLRVLSQEAKRVAKLAIDGKAGPEELREGTFTVTNLGALGVDYFTPVLNPPQVGILGVGGIEPAPLSLDEPDTFIPKIALSLTIDHQGVDGAPGARFLGRVAEMLAEIDLVLAQ